MPPHSESNPLANVLSSVRQAFVGVGLFSFVINILMLTGPLFMLQVYDRILTSRSVPTLVALFALVVALYAFLGLFDFLRTRLLSRVGHRLDADLMGPSFRTWIFQGLSGRKELSRPVNDLTTVRMFMGSPGLPAMFDLPWTPIYLAIVFLLHFKLGLLALAGACIVIVLALVNEWSTKRVMGEGAVLDLQEQQFADYTHRNAEAVVAMGMTGQIVRFWSSFRQHSINRSQIGSERGERLAAMSKAFRMLLQSAILALGAYLAILQEISPGTIIAASIIAGRALAPIDQTLGNWRNIMRARQAYHRLSERLQHTETLSSTPTVALQKPKGQLTVSNVLKRAPGGADTDRPPLLQGINFKLNPGDSVGVIGPSASGKTSLARLLVGLWLPDQGSVRLDGATFDQWDVDKLGSYIGYLPQDVELLPGTVQQNIARFDPDAKDEEIIAAAECAGVHRLILSLPDGYATEIGPGRTVVSGGQAQRIALARAVFRIPSLVVLDEPNANLDADGDQALTACITALREAGSAVVVMAHRPSAIAAVNMILMLQDGRQAEFGPKSDVMRKVTRVATA